MNIFLEFEKRTGFVNCIGAIDGTLIEIKRFSDFHGWYCRKLFPAFAAQIVVNHRKEIISFSLRSGSQSDKSLFNNSEFGQYIHQLIPTGCFFLADAGYKLFSHILTPYKIDENMSEIQAHYNYHHSRTRMIVEQAIGLLKTKFRIFRAPLIHLTPENMARVITSCFVLHNWIIQANEPTPTVRIEPWMHVGGDIVLAREMYTADGLIARNNRDRIAQYVWENIP